jgi:hypothetical protein
VFEEVAVAREDPLAAPAGPAVDVDVALHLLAARRTPVPEPHAPAALPGVGELLQVLLDTLRSVRGELSRRRRAGGQAASPLH